MEQHELGNECDLAVYRLERARTDLKSAKLLFDAAEYKGANNRAYYAVYHAITAVPVSYTHLDVYKRQICGRE